MIRDGRKIEVEVIGRRVDVTGDEDYRRIKGAGIPLITENVVFVPVLYYEGGCDVVRVIDGALDSFGLRGNSKGIGNPGIELLLQECEQLPTIRTCEGGVHVELLSVRKQRVNIALYFVTMNKIQKRDSIRFLGLPATT